MTSDPLPRLLAVTAAFLIGTCSATAGTLPSLQSPEPYDLQAAGFELSAPVEIEIEAVGMWDPPGLFQWSWGSEDRQDRMKVYAWVLDGATRKPIWRLEPDNSDAVDGTSYLRQGSATLKLDPGRYEVYLFSGLGAIGSSQGSDSDDDRSWWERMFSGDPRKAEEIREDLRRCSVSLTARGAGGNAVSSFEITGDLPDGLIRMNGVGDSVFRSAGFRLDRSSTLRVYSLYEHTEDATYPSDYAWIVNARTREVEWSPGSSRKDPAGGGDKNRRVAEEIGLDAGSYVVYFGSDDSHSLDEFNVNPPHDPYNWGFTLFPGSGFDPASFSVETPEDAVEPAIAFREVGDRAFFEQPFRLNRSVPIRILALGEYVGGNDFADRAWIVSGTTGEVVWTMDGSNTRGAGGSEKNRMFDGLARLPVDDYVLFYESDDSHSAAGWNAAAPFRPDAWGVTVWPTEKDALVLLDGDDPSPRGDVLADLTRVGDAEHRRARFTLTQAATVRIRAVGEGGGGELHDRGWIVSVDSGDTVWSMEYRDTQHAGGADKNRKSQGVVKLPAGTYEAHFVTDDSHAFGSWNDGAPRDPTAWGLVVRLVEG